MAYSHRLAAFILLVFLVPIQALPAGKEQVGKPSKVSGSVALREKLIQEAATAIKNHNQGQLLRANEAIWSALSRMPAWAESKLSSAEKLPATPAVASAVAQWNQYREAAQQAAGRGEYDQAGSGIAQALSVAQKALGPGHVATLFTLREQATLFAVQGRLDEALTAMAQAVAGVAKALSERHPEYLGTRLELARLRLERGLWSEARQDVEAIRQADLAVDGVPHALRWQAGLMRLSLDRRRGQWREGLKEAGVFCPALERVVGAFHEQFAECRMEWAELLLGAGSFREASLALEEAEAILSRLRPEVDPLRVRTLLLTAELKRRLGHPDKALALLDPWAARERQEGWPRSERWRLLSFLSRIHSDLGHPQEAEALLSGLIADLEPTLGPDHPALMSLLVDRAELWRGQGALRQAKEALAALMPRISERLGADHPATLAAASNLGLVLEAMGDYDEAETLIRQTLATVKGTLGEGHPLTVAAINNLAMLLESQGRFGEAESLYFQGLSAALALHGPDHPEHAALRNNLAHLLLLLDESAKAEPEFVTVHALLRERQGEFHQDTLKALNNIGRARLAQRRLDEAERSLTEAWQGRKAHLGERHLDTLRSRLDLGRLWIAQDRLVEAEGMLTAALSDSEQALGPLHPYTFEILNALAELLERLDRLPEVLRLREEGFRRRTQFLDRMVWVADDAAREGYIRLHRPELDGYIRLLARWGDQQAAGRALMQVAVARKGLLLKVTAERRQVMAMAKDPGLASVVKGLEADRRELARRILSGPGPGQTEESFRVALHQLEERIRHANLELGRTSLRFRQRHQDRQIEEIEAAVREGEALVEFLVYHHPGGKGLVAAVATRQQGRVGYRLVHYPDATPIDSQIVALRGAIQNPELPASSLKEQARGLHGQLWQPLGLAPGGNARVYVVPDDQLNILPFGALVDGSGRYLAEVHSLHFLGSVRDLLDKTPGSIDGVTIFAGPDYDDDRMAVKPAGGEGAPVLPDSPAGLRSVVAALRVHFAFLPGAEREGSMIQQLVAAKGLGSQLFSGKEARELKLSSLSTESGVLHIATHGFFAKPDEQLGRRLFKVLRGGAGMGNRGPPPGDNPLLRSGLAFAGINRNLGRLGSVDMRDDGLLTGQEVLDLDLGRFRLAVLSACETGLGELHEGEGVYGLRRAFQEAGVPLVLSSLWEVDDIGTMVLMKEFYTNLLTMPSVGEAFEKAQRTLMNSSQWRHPVIWSAFMLSGHRGGESQ